MAAGNLGIKWCLAMFTLWPFLWGM